jgi:hypothetical protein
MGARVRIYPCYNFFWHVEGMPRGEIASHRPVVRELHLALEINPADSLVSKVHELIHEAVSLRD